MWRLAFVLVFLVCVPKSLESQMQGVYTMTIHNVTKCDREEMGDQKVLLIPWYTETYFRNGKQFAKFNFTVPKNGLAGIRMHTTVVLFEKDKTLKAMDVEGSMCVHYVLKLFSEALRLSLSKKDCRLREGFYYVDGVDLDKASHQVVQVFVYGTFLATLRASTPQGLTFCGKMFFETKPIV